RSSAAAGMAPSEWLIRYVVSARIGNRSRYSSRSPTCREYRERKSPVLDPSTEGFCARIPFQGDGGARGAGIGWIQIRSVHAERGSGLRRGGGSCGESRASGLWGTRRGGRGTDGRQHTSGKRGLLALLVLALAAPLAATASGGNGSPQSYLAPSLERAATQTPDRSVAVIVQGPSASDARHALDRFGSVGERLGVVNAAAGTIKAGDLAQLSAQPGLVITPDNPVLLDTGHQTDTGLSSGEPWPHAVGVDQFWSQAPKWKKHHGNGGGGGRPMGAAPTIAFVDSGIETGRTDFGDRILASVDLTSLPDNSPGDGYGHGTIVAGLAAGSAPRYTGAAP